MQSLSFAQTSFNFAQKAVLSANKEARTNTYAGEQFKGQLSRFPRFAAVASIATSIKSVGDAVYGAGSAMKATYQAVRHFNLAKAATSAEASAQRFAIVTANTILAASMGLFLVNNNLGNALRDAASEFTGNIALVLANRSSNLEGVDAKALPRDTQKTWGRFAFSLIEKSTAVRVNAGQKAYTKPLYAVKNFAASRFYSVGAMFASVGFVGDALNATGATLKAIGFAAIRKTDKASISWTSAKVSTAAATTHAAALPIALLSVFYSGWAKMAQANTTTFAGTVAESLDFNALDSETAVKAWAPKAQEVKKPEPKAADPVKDPAPEPTPHSAE